MVTSNIKIVASGSPVVVLENASTNSRGGHSDVSWCIVMPQYVTKDATTGKLKKFNNQYVLSSPLYKKGQVVKFAEDRNNTSADYWPILPGPWWIVLIANDVTYSGQYPVTTYKYSAVQVVKNASGALVAGAVIGHDEVVARKLHLLSNEMKSEESRAVDSQLFSDASAWARTLPKV